MDLKTPEVPIIAKPMDPFLGRQLQILLECLDCSKVAEVLDSYTT